MVFENVNLPITVTSVATETPGYWSVYFERPKRFTFAAGDWMEISFPGQHLPGGTVYSFSSSPNESELRITFRQGSSPFKKALQIMKPGDKLVMTEYGNDYEFRLREHKAGTLIAGGVGVAPFRSMLKEMLETSSKNQIQLIFLSTTEVFLFAEEFNEWQKVLPGLDIQYLATGELNTKARDKVLKALFSDFCNQFYVSGPSGMVASTIELLERNGVDRRSIKIDDFGHY